MGQGATTQTAEGVGTIETATLDDRVRKVKDDVVGWRRHLHRNPELSLHEEENSQFVHETLLSFGGLELSRPTPTTDERGRAGRGGSPGTDG